MHAFRPSAARGLLLAALAVLGAGTCALALGSSASSDDLYEPAPGISADAASARVDALRREANVHQRAAFADGVLTVAEYRTATHATIACLRERAAGVAEKAGGVLEVSEPQTSSDSFALSYTFGIRVAQGAGRELAPDEGGLAAVERDCRQQFVTAVEEGYWTQRLADPAYVKWVEAALRRCVASAGGDRAPDKSVRDLLATSLRGATPDSPLHDRLTACMTAHPSVMHIPS